MQIRGSVSGGSRGALAPPEFGRPLISPPGFLELNLVICGMKDAWLAKADKSIRISPPEFKS